MQFPPVDTHPVPFVTGQFLTHLTPRVKSAVGPGPIGRLATVRGARHPPAPIAPHLRSKERNLRAQSVRIDTVQWYDHHRRHTTSRQRHPEPTPVRAPPRQVTVTIETKPPPDAGRAPLDDVRGSVRAPRRTGPPQPPPPPRRVPHPRRRTRASPSSSPGTTTTPPAWPCSPTTSTSSPRSARRSSGASTPTKPPADAIFFGIMVFVAAGHRGKTTFARLVGSMGQLTAQHHGVVIFDVCQHNAETLGLERQMASIARWFPNSTFAKIDTQSYYAVRLPTALADGHGSSLSVTAVAGAGGAAVGLARRAGGAGRPPHARRLAVMAPGSRRPDRGPRAVGADAHRSSRSGGRRCRRPAAAGRKGIPGRDGSRGPAGAAAWISISTPFGHHAHPEGVGHGDDGLHHRVVGLARRRGPATNERSTFTCSIGKRRR